MTTQLQIGDRTVKWSSIQSGTLVSTSDDMFHLVFTKTQYLYTSRKYIGTTPRKNIRIPGEIIALGITRKISLVQVQNLIAFYKTWKILSKIKGLCPMCSTNILMTKKEINMCDHVPKTKYDK